MTALITAIEQATELLKKVQASTLESAFLRQIEEDLQTADVHDALKAFQRSLPPAPDDPDEREAHRKSMAAYADRLNHAAEPYLQELERIKRMRQTLNLDALDPVIRAGRTIIHRIHGFTAEIQG